MTAALVDVAFHEAGHFTRPVPRRFRDLFVDDFHEAQVLSAFAYPLIVKPRPLQPQQFALFTKA